MKRIFALFLAVLLLTGCDLAPSQGDYPPDSETLVIGTTLDESVYGPLVREFEARTGVWTLVQEGKASELLEKAEAGKLSCDLLLGCSAETLSAHEELFAPYATEIPQAVSASACCHHGKWLPFTTRRVVLIYNPMLVRRNPPKGFASLLDPAWKGKIAFADPQASSSAFTELTTLTLALPDTPDAIPLFRQNLDGVLLERSSDVVSRVADGTYYIGLALEEDAVQARNLGYDIAVVYPQEGTCEVPDGMAILQNCEHPENAQRFMEFALSLDAQEGLALACSRIPVREDAMEERSFRLLPYDIPGAAQSRDSLLLRWEAAA